MSCEETIYILGKKYYFHLFKYCETDSGKYKALALQYVQGHSVFHKFRSPMLSECVSKLLSILMYFLVSIYLYLANVQIYTGLTDRYLASTILSLSALSASSSAGEQFSSQGIFTVSHWKHQSIQFSTGTLEYILPTWVLVVWGFFLAFILKLYWLWDSLLNLLSWFRKGTSIFVQHVRCTGAYGIE